MKGRNNMKRTISFLMALVLILSMVPFSAMALEPAAKFETYTYINPLYADVITEADLNSVKAPAAAPHASGDPVYAATFAEAGAQMRQPMVGREETIVVYYQTNNYDSAQHKDIFNAAVAHTGNPDEGDALRWVYAGYKVGIRKSVQNGISYVTYTYTMTYYTTAEQEKELDAAKAQLLATVDPNGSDYEKLKTVYDYICANITYDYDTLYDDDYKLKFTAYAALINKTAVCQGYAVLLYQLALELGIDCRVITGIGNSGDHGWNIVKFGDFYYNTDSTWDAIWYQALGYYNYFLQNEDTFTSGGTDHYRDAEYDTTEFHAMYPISATNFDPDEYVPELPEPEPDPDSCGSGLTWALEDGILTISGSGAMNDYNGSAAPWNDRRNEITTLIVGEGVTYIGASAFRDCANLRAIYFLGNAPQFGDNRVFGGVIATVFYFVTDPTWTADVMGNLGGALMWQPMCPGHAWGEWIVEAYPTCEENGVMRSTCAICGEYDEELIPALGHNYTMNVVEATCTAPGYTAYSCVNCGDSFADSYVDALGHSYTAEVVAPTCTEEGYTTYTCSCGESYKDNYVASLGHTFESEVTEVTCLTDGYTTFTCHCGFSYQDFWVLAPGHNYDSMTTDPTCTEDGHTTYTCSGCGDTYTNTIPATGHDHQAVVTAPTCTTQGCTTYTCRCGDSYTVDVVDALGHSWDDGVVTKDSTETNTGLKVYTCITCGETMEEILPALGHSHSYAAEVVAPTCTEEGYTVYTCACGHSYRDNFVDPLGHTFESEVTEATCLTDGYTTFTCHCGYSYQDFWVLAPGHFYDSWTTNPTCTEAGHTTYICSGCGDTYTDAIPAKGHDHKATVTAPTCTERGFTTYVCHCGDTYFDDYVDAKGHDYKATVTAPTCTEQGFTTYICHCGDTYFDDYVDAKGHDYKATVTAPTCTEQGFTTYVCHCGGTYVGDYVDAKGHEYDNGTCADCGNIAIAAPKVKGSNKASNGKISLTWEKVDGAEKYEVYRATSKTGKYSRMKTTTSTTYTNTSAKAGKYYYYYVRAIDADGNYADSNIIGRTCDLAQTKVTLSNVASSGKVKISWEAVEGATKYEVYRATSKNGTYSRISTTSNTSVTNTKADAGKTYYYKVRAICDVDAAAAAYSEVKSRTCDLAQPKVSIGLSSKKPKVSWGKVTGAVEYKVYRATSKNGTYSLVKTTTSLSYKDTKASSGKTYYYKVVAVCSNTAGNSAYSPIVSIKSK